MLSLDLLNLFLEVGDDLLLARRFKIKVSNFALDIRVDVLDQIDERVLGLPLLFGSS